MLLVNVVISYRELQNQIIIDYLKFRLDILNSNNKNIMSTILILKVQKFYGLKLLAEEFRYPN